MPFLEITTISFCKNVCSYCPQNTLLKRYGKKEIMTMETFKKCIDKVPNNVVIDFAGYAEPFLNPEAVDMVEYAYNKGHIVRVYTTLVGLNKEKIDRLSKILGLPFVLHLPDNLGHMKANVDEDYIETCRYFAKSIHYVSAEVFGPIHESIKSIFPDVLERKLTNEHLHTRANSLDSQRIELKAHFYQKGPIECGVIAREGGSKLDHNVLLPNGNVQMCCMDYGLTSKFGNLLTDNYDDLFSSEEYNRIRRAMTEEDSDIICRTCKECYPKK